MVLMSYFNNQGQTFRLKGNFSLLKTIYDFFLIEVQQFKAFATNSRLPQELQELTTNYTIS